MTAFTMARASARLTAPMVGAGAVARKWLKEQYGTSFRGCMTHLGEQAIAFEGWEHVGANPFFAANASQIEALEAYMDALRKSGRAQLERARSLAEKEGVAAETALV